MIPSYAYHKPFKIHLPNKYELQNGFNPDKKGGLVWYTDSSKMGESTGVRVYRWDSK